MSLESQVKATNKTQRKVVSGALGKSGEIEAWTRGGAGELRGGRPLIIRLTRSLED